MLAISVILTLLPIAHKITFQRYDYHSSQVSDLPQMVLWPIPFWLDAPTAREMLKSTCTLYIFGTHSIFGVFV